EDLVAKEYRAAMLKRMTEGHTVPGSLAATATTTATTGEGSDDDDDDDDDDEGFLGSYRRRRLEQLKATAGRPQFGQIVEAERSTFVSAVDTEDPRTSVVVHLYEPYIDACRRMNRFLEVSCSVPKEVRGERSNTKTCPVPVLTPPALYTAYLLSAHNQVLATKQPTVKFLRLRSSAAEGGDYDPVALPTLLLYRAGEVVGCMTRVTDDIGENFTQEDVEWLLQEHDVFEAS
ncbi:unnamed protein product, partial [Ectocarpus fasciculatus]